MLELIKFTKATGDGGKLALRTFTATSRSPIRLDARHLGERRRVFRSTGGVGTRDWNLPDQAKVTPLVGYSKNPWLPKSFSTKPDALWELFYQVLVSTMVLIPIIFEM
jgi:hypothetical protein